ncbi:MAG: RluA family pseudouridine synthase [Bacteroidota bacterium]
MKPKENLSGTEASDIWNNINYPDYIETIFNFSIPKGQEAERLDLYLARSIRNATRTKVQKAIEAGCVIVNGKVKKSNYKIQPLDSIVCTIMKPPPIQLIPEDIPLEIVYEDDFMLVVNKPVGMCSHPGFGNRQGTLVNAVLYHLGMREPIPIELDEDSEEIEDDSDIPVITEGSVFASSAIRPGLVHRLDKDTSGLLVISKNPQTHAQLAKQFFDRTTSRFYYALVWGEFKENKGTYEGDIGRSSRDRKLFAIVKKDGKPAITDYEVLERFDYLTLVKVKLRTGRTHQIRVHFSHNKHPVFGDVSYGGDSIVFGGHNIQFRKLAENCLKMTSHQLLHAKTLGFVHPDNNELKQFESSIPDDFIEILELFRIYQKNKEL